MSHPKSLLTKVLRPAMIPAVLLLVIASGCADQQPLAPELVRPVAQSSAVPFNKFFIAWSEHYNSSPLQIQMFTLDARQERQFADFADERVLSFAKANPGRHYINGDEPDQ